MNFSQRVGVVPMDRQDDSADVAGSDSVSVKSLWHRRRRAIHRTRQWLLGQQDIDGSWCAELEGDTILESETILLLAFLGQEDEELAGKCAGLPGREATARRRLGHVPRRTPGNQRQCEGLFRPETDRPRPERRIHAAGPRRRFWPPAGPMPSTATRRYYLALLGQISYEQCPAVPPEVVLLPKWFPVNLYAVSSWSRTIIVPLSILSAFQSRTPTGAAAGDPRAFLAGTGRVARAAAVPGCPAERVR